MLWWGQTLFQSGRINRNLIWIDWEAISPVMTNTYFCIGKLNNRNKERRFIIYNLGHPIAMDVLVSLILQNVQLDAN